MDFDYKQVERDFKAYNRAAKKAKAYTFDINLDTHYVTDGFYAKVDKDVFCEVKAKQPKFRFFTNKIEEYVNRGIPICWTLVLGMFPEEGLPQSWGGHMRIIHGYNKKTEEILYTDSWGSGHEMKRMPAIEGWCMSRGLYAMVPNN